MNPAIAGLLTIFIYFLIAAVLIRALMSWFPISRDNPFAQAVHQVTEPLLEPVRRIMPNTGMIDLSAMIVILILWLMLAVVNQVAE